MSLVELPCPADVPPSDADLLRRFMERHDRQAAETLIQRHGQLVMDVCRRILGRSADADDAFQATFLVLLRGGLRLREPRSLAAWLYGTAWRIAVRLRSKLARQQSMEAGMEPHATENPFEQVAARHDLEVFDAELARLPERYRASLVLHYLEGRSQREIAQTLGATEAAVEGLLKRGRTELRARLARRGVVLTTTLAAVAVQEGLLSAADWSPLVESTIQAATVQSPQAWENASNAPRAETLFQQELKIMWLQKLTLGGAIAAGGTLAVTLLGWTLLGNSLTVGAAEGPSGLTSVSSEIVLAAAEEPAAVAVEAPAAGALVAGSEKPRSDSFLIRAAEGAPFGPGAPGGGAFAGSPPNRQPDEEGAYFPDLSAQPAQRFPGGGLAGAPGDIPAVNPAAALSMPLDQETLDELLERPIQLNYQQVDWIAMLMTLQLNGLPIELDLVKEFNQLGVNPLEKVNLNIGKVSTKTALRLLLKPHGLEAKLIDGKLKIVRSDAVVGGGAMRQMSAMAGGGDMISGGEMMSGGFSTGGQSGPALQRAFVSPLEERIEKALRGPSEADFVDMPLKDALDFLKQHHGIQIWIDEVKLTEAGIGDDTSVTLQTTGVSLRSVLKLLLEPLKLDYIVEDEVMKVTSKAYAEERIVTRIFRSQLDSTVVNVLAETAKIEANGFPVGVGGSTVVIVTGKPDAIRRFEEIAEQVGDAMQPEIAAPAASGPGGSLPPAAAD